MQKNGFQTYVQYKNQFVANSQFVNCNQSLQNHFNFFGLIPKQLIICFQAVSKANNYQTQHEPERKIKNVNRNLPVNLEVQQEFPKPFINNSNQINSCQQQFAQKKSELPQSYLKLKNENAQQEFPNTHENEKILTRNSTQFQSQQEFPKAFEISNKNMSFTESCINSTNTNKRAYKFYQNQISCYSGKQSTNTGGYDPKSPKLSLFDRIIELNSIEGDNQAQNEREQNQNINIPSAHINNKVINKLSQIQLSLNCSKNQEFQDKNYLTINKDIAQPKINLQSNDQISQLQQLKDLNQEQIYQKSIFKINKRSEKLLNKMSGFKDNRWTMNNQECRYSQDVVSKKFMEENEIEEFWKVIIKSGKDFYCQQIAKQNQKIKDYYKRLKAQDHLDNIKKIQPNFQLMDKVPETQDLIVYEFKKDHKFKTFKIYECRCSKMIQPQKSGLEKNACILQCLKTFRSKSKFYAHLRVHTNEKPFYCPLEQCTFRFNQISNLNHHISKYHHDYQKTEKQNYHQAHCSKQIFHVQKIYK